MADPTGGMFEARLKLEDDSSATIEGITSKIDKAIGNTEQLQKEFKRLHGRLDKMHESTKSILKDTNDIGMIPSALLGINDKGSVKEQFFSLKNMAGDFFKFISGLAVDATLELADASLGAADAVGKLYWVMSGMAALMKFPAMLVGSAIETMALTGVIEELRHEMLMTNDQAIKMGSNISHTMLQAGSDIELVIDAYSELAKLGQLNTKNVEQLADATVYLSEAWRLAAGDVANFNRRIADLYEVGRGKILGVASAMDHVARSTAISRGELMGLVDSLETDLMFKLPKTLRSKVMPRMLADISAIAGEWANMFGDPRVVREGFSKVIDVFDMEGQRLRAMIIGLGGATQEGMSAIISGGDAGSFWLAQLKAIQNLKKELGDGRFTQVAGIYAEQMGLTRDAFMRMSETSIEATEARMKLAREELKSTKSIREAWDRAQGVFNEVWKRLENIGKALLIGIGEPLLNLIIPAVDWLGKKLTLVVELFQGVGDAEKKMMGLGVVLGTIVAVFKSGIIPMFTWLWTYVIAPLVSVAGPAIASVLVPALVAVGIALAKIALVGAIAFGVIKAIYDWGGAFIDGLGDSLDRVWGLLKIIGAVLLMVFAPPIAIIGALIYGIIEYWDTLYASMKFGLDELSKAWNDITEIFKWLGEEMSKQLGKAFGSSGSEAVGFFDLLGGLLEGTIYVIGKIVGVIIWLIAQVVKAVGFAAAAILTILAPVIFVFNLIHWAIMQIVDGLSMILNLASSALGFGGFGKFAGLGGEAIPMATGGFTTEDNVNTVLHKNEAVIPLEKFPEVVGSTVYVEQEMVVDELKLMRAVMERMLRKGGMAAGLQGG